MNSKGTWSVHSTTLSLSFSFFLNGNNYTYLVESVLSMHSVDFFSSVVVAAAAAVEIRQEEGQNLSSEKIFLEK